MPRRELVESEIERLLSEAHYSEALASILRLRKSLVRSKDPVPQARMFYLHSKCLYKLGRYTEALLKIRSAARIITHETTDNAFLADIKHILGLILIRLGRFADAEEALTESYVFYKRTHDYKSVLFPLSHMAQLHYITGNLRRSCEVLELSIKYAEKYHSQDRVDNDKRNLARVLTTMAQLDKASAVLDSLSPASSDLRSQASTAFLKGMVAVFRMQTPLAQRQLESAQQLFTELRISQDLNVCIEYLGLLWHFEGNYAKAREYYQKVLDMPEPTASAVAQTLRMLTGVYIAEGKFDLAEETAVKAEAAITKINERIELGALYRAHGEIHTHKKETKTARDYFQKSIDLLREIGARYELALSYMAAGESESYSIDERRRHLEMSRMLFVEMDVPKRVEQVEATIAQLRVESVVADPPQHGNVAVPTIITANREMRDILATVERIKDTTHTVLITGETGTGKDLLAEYIHRSSIRADKPFRIVNTAAIPSELLESELFGYRRGTYTGANQDKVGLIESAEGGTFYFDEIGDAPLDAQTKLLRVLDTKSVRRLGTTSDIKVDVRFIAATNIDLKQMMESGRFRRDLYYRLQEMPIHLPPLRERLDDIGLLVEYFLRGTGFENAGTDTCT